MRCWHCSLTTSIPTAMYCASWLDTLNSRYEDGLCSISITRHAYLEQNLIALQEEQSSAQMTKQLAIQQARFDIDAKAE